MPIDLISLVKLVGAPMFVMWVASNLLARLPAWVKLNGQTKGYLITSLNLLLGIASTVLLSQLTGTALTVDTIYQAIAATGAAYAAGQFNFVQSADAVQTAVKAQLGLPAPVKAG